MAENRVKLILLGNEKETKKSHIVTTFVVSNGGKYEAKQTIIQSINTNYNNINQMLTFQTTQINITPTYNLNKDYKSAHDQQIKTLYNSADIIFIIYNVCNSKSFQNAIKYYEQYEENKDKNANSIIVLIGHKFGSYTSFKRDVKKEEGQQYASKHNLFHSEVSTTDYSIPSLFQNIGKLFLAQTSANNIKPANISPKIAKMMNIVSMPTMPQFVSNPFRKNKNSKNRNDIDIKDEEESDIEILHEKIKDYESIVFALEHTLSLHENEKKQLLDKNFEYENESMQLKLENESKQRQINRQMEEVKQLIADLRYKNNEIEELKNVNNSAPRTRSIPKPPPRRNSNSDCDQQPLQALLVNEKPITTKNRQRSQTTKTDNNSNIFSGFSKLQNIFSSKLSSNEDLIDITDAKQAEWLVTKCESFERMCESLKKINCEQNDEMEVLKHSNIDILQQIGVKQKEINHLRECLEDNQIGFTRYKEESEQKLSKWKKEKIYWFDKYKQLCKENQTLVQEKRKLQRDNKKLERSKNKYKQRVLLSADATNANAQKMHVQIAADVGDDIIKMDRITMDSFTFGCDKYDERLWSVPQLLRSFKALKTNYYNNLIEKIMDFEEENEDIDNDEEMVICMLFDTVIECYLLIGNKTDILSSTDMFDEMEENKEKIFETMQDKFDEKFAVWFDDQEGSDLCGDFKNYVRNCLEMCILIKYFELELFPKGDRQSLQFEINDLLDYGDVMERDDMFDSTLNDNGWTCSFPAIIKNENELNEQQTLQIINEKSTDKYNIFESKLWMYRGKE